MSLEALVNNKDLNIKDFESEVSKIDPKFNIYRDIPSDILNKVFNSQEDYLASNPNYISTFSGLADLIILFSKENIIENTRLKYAYERSIEEWDLEPSFNDLLNEGHNAENLFNLEIVAPGYINKSINNKKLLPDFNKKIFDNFIDEFKNKKIYGITEDIHKVSRLSYVNKLYPEMKIPKKLEFLKEKMLNGKFQFLFEGNINYDLNIYLPFANLFPELVDYIFNDENWKNAKANILKKEEAPTIFMRYASILTQLSNLSKLNNKDHDFLEPIPTTRNF